MKGVTVVMCLLFSFPCLGQDYEYSIKMGNREIGAIQAKILTDGDRKVYRINSDTEVNILKTISYTSQIEVTYLDKELLEATSKSLQNGKVRDDSWVKKVEDHYAIKRLDADLTYRAPIRYSVALLYFQEPLGITQIFSETHGAFCKLVKEVDHVYKLVLPDGNMNFYHYANGILQKVEVKRPAYSLTFVLVSN